MTTQWRPGADQAALIARAELLTQVRHFFAQRKLLEVETPLLCKGAPTDPHLESLQVNTHNGNRFLQTSPEFAMKRLLAAGSGDIYQICKSFRAGESSPRHNPEFTMLEWYRLGINLTGLIAEVTDLLKLVLGELPIFKTSYQQLFEQYLGVNPHQLSNSAIAELGRKVAGRELNTMARADWLDLLMSQVIEPRLPQGIAIIEDFPACQAALSRVVEDTTGNQIAKRFEVYVGGVELANGYLELLDSDELAKRFETDRQIRGEQGLVTNVGDDYLLAAMQEGLPACVGVAVGLDRLLMTKTGSNDIAKLLSFPVGNA
jgi:lysyl-tRNA synthetase class 2